MRFHAETKWWKLIKDIKHIDFHSDWSVTVNDWIEVVLIKEVFTKDQINSFKKIIPPKLSRVTSYCNMRKNGIDPQTFIDHYDSIWWMRGKTKVKDRQATIRTWEKNVANKPVPVDATKQKESRRNKDKIMDRLNN